jgi:PPM family protein phosphatase
MVQARAVDDLLTIGEFSERCGLSPKMLRTYAATGLLVPAGVDRFTGYRYYAPSQAGQARAIGLLRQAGRPLRDIASFLGRPAAERLDEWERELGAELTVRRRALAEARALLAPVLTGQGPASREPGPEAGRRFMAGSASATGTARSANQDAVLACGFACVVADGMGERGAVASLLAVEIVQAAFAVDRSAGGLARACRIANDSVWRRGTGNADAAMGTTVVAAGIVRDGDDEALAVAHVGDSRAYLLRCGNLRRLTEDHSLVTELVRSGELTGAAARVHPQRSLLTRALGMGPDPEPELTVIHPEPGDRLLLCTDGLFSEVLDDEIAAALAGGGEPAGTATGLTRLAAGRGGRDDISAVVMDLDGGPDDGQAG